MSSAAYRPAITDARGMEGEESEAAAAPEIIELTPLALPPRPADGGRLPLLLAATALLVSLAALALAYTGRGAAAACTRAWDAIPTNLVLPPGWTLRDTWYSSTGVTVAIDEAGMPTREGAAFVSWDCYGDGPGAVRFLALTRTAAEGNASAKVIDFPTIGEETLALEKGNASSDEFDVYWRSGDLITWLQGAPGTNLVDMVSLATAFEEASRR